MDYTSAFKILTDMTVGIAGSDIIIASDDNSAPAIDKQKMTTALGFALKAVSKQIPMEIQEIHCDEYFCPACGSENNADEHKVTHTYCPECGQRLYVKTEE